MMSYLGLFIILYLGILFFVARQSEKKANTKWIYNSYVYTSFLAVYCSIWTYNGSIDVVTKSGLRYLKVYLGSIIIPTWIINLVKVFEFLVSI